MCMVTPVNAKISKIQGHADTEADQNLGKSLAFNLYLEEAGLEGGSAPQNEEFNMRQILGVSVAMLIWGSQAVANLPPPGPAEDRQRISDWAAHLNRYYPTLDLRVRANLNQDTNVRSVLRELKLLEENLLGTIQLPVRSLKALACAKIVCGDKD